MFIQLSSTFDSFKGVDLLGKKHTDTSCMIIWCDTLTFGVMILMYVSHPVKCLCFNSHVEPPFVGLWQVISSAWQHQQLLGCHLVQNYESAKGDKHLWHNNLVDFGCIFGAGEPLDIAIKTHMCLKMTTNTESFSRWCKFMRCCLGSKGRYPWATQLTIGNLRAPPKC